MRFLRYASNAGPELGAYVDGRILSVASMLRNYQDRGRARGVPSQLLSAVSTDPEALLLAWPVLRSVIESAAESDDGSAVVADDLTSLAILPPVEKPINVLGASYNYNQLAADEGIEAAKDPSVFAKAPGSVVGAFDEIHVPPSIRNVDFEAEVGVIIGQVTRQVDRAEAARCIGAYVAFNDLTSKLLPRPSLDIETTVLSLKAVDGFAPVGAVAVTADELTDFNGLQVKCWVNGEQRQKFAADDWIREPSEIVSYLSSFMTLYPGDMVCMGTSTGIGIAELPPRLIGDGDVVEVAIGDIPGTRNVIRFAQDGDWSRRP